MANPPKLFLRFFRWYCHPRLLKPIEGDLMELYEERVKELGKRKADWHFIKDVILLFRKDIIKPAEGSQKLNYYGMLKNYFITSLRFIKREKTFALMNISGLALGIACAITIYKILDYELSYDTHHANYDRIYRVINEDLTSDGKRLSRSQVHPLAHALRTDFPSINAAMTFYEKDGLIGIDDGKGNIQRFQEKNGIAFVEPQFLTLFSAQFLHGNAANALDEPGKVVLTRSKAKKYFGISDHNLHEVIGRSLTIENTKTTFVSAVIEDFPKTTDLPFEVLFHYQDQDTTNPWFFDGKSWGEYNSATNCYVMLNDNISVAALEGQLKPFVQKYLPEYIAEARTYRLQPLSDLHYSDEIRRTYAGITATKGELTVLGLVGILLLITACINFINLSTAQAVKRSKEVGVRKTMGSSKQQLVIQFICETFLITLLATVLGTALSSLFIKEVGIILDYPLALNLASTEVIGFLLTLVALVTILAGLYPSFVLAKMNPVLAIKNSLNIKQTSGFLSLRRGLVVLQFAISQTLIIGILILKSQMSYLQTKDLGFNEESIMVVKLPENDSTNLAVLKNELRSHSYIRNVSFSSSGPMASWKSTNPIFHPNIEGQDQHGNLKSVDVDYFDTYEMHMVAGEPFKKGDPRTHVVVNRRVTEVLGFMNPEEALGERVKYGRGSMEFTIVGVVEDFHANSLHADLDNVFMANVGWNIFQAGIKLGAEHTNYTDLREVLTHVEQSWTAQFPEHVFEFEFYDDQLNSYYKLEESVSKVMQGFVIIAILIGALGLYGLVAFMANQKTKEIGIRKVMGASKIAIWNIFSKELLILMTIAFFVSAPVSYYIMRAFLNTYTYRIALGPQFFIWAILVSILIALITVGYKSLRVASTNPVVSLRDE